jgi:hypothetical protein
MDICLRSILSENSYERYVNKLTVFALQIISIN